ncbi:hypothetical protein JTE90_019381 [Oedothorax gibbosus]|uniref:Uncharacterized protein n=1 Tax=Oedothorax gibbosus TaxID=931172 RepID=A0AAV6TFR8_9ARAC|nr:hypothetical protein JTE90_019381 [Oedothorax gibbosus]
MGQSVLRDRRNPFRKRERGPKTKPCSCLSRCRPKGEGVNIPKPGQEIGPSGPKGAVTQPNSERRRRPRGKVIFFLCKVSPFPGMGLVRDRDPLP